jgi:mono/diheme cytochrome c family protein
VRGEAKSPHTGSGTFHCDTLGGVTKTVLLLATAIGTCVAQAPRPAPWEKNRLRIAQALYRENCVVCHDVDQAASKKPGPSFYHLFQRDKMPMANMKPSREYIKVRVKFGGPLMPAFAKTLSDSEIDLIVDYLGTK